MCCLKKVQQTLFLHILFVLILTKLHSMFSTLRRTAVFSEEKATGVRIPAMQSQIMTGRVWRLSIGLCR